MKPINRPWATYCVTEHKTNGSHVAADFKRVKGGIRRLLENKGLGINMQL